MSKSPSEGGAPTPTTAQIKNEGVSTPAIEGEAGSHTVGDSQQQGGEQALHTGVAAGNGSASKGQDQQQSSKKKGKFEPKERIYPVFHHDASQSSFSAGTKLLSRAMRTHPKGFKILSSGSPLERRMGSYFRLPRQPPKRQKEELLRVRTQLKNDEHRSGAGARGTHGTVLDGFMLLEKSGVGDPEAAREAVINDAEIVATEPQDLTFFTNLTFLDLGENMVQLNQLLALENLEEIHLHCNLLMDVELPDEYTPPAPPEEGGGIKNKGQGKEEDVEEGEDLRATTAMFPRLQTLNLSFNKISPKTLHHLAKVDNLERLDLSCNSIRRLPKDLSFLHNVRQMALENNKLSDPNSLIALSTMPSLMEINLNYNQFATFPKIAAMGASHGDDDVGRGGFQSLEVIGLASNNITYVEDTYALSQLPSLKRVVLWGNPIEKRHKDVEILLYEFGNLGIQVVLDSPIPPKRKVGAFYSANTQNFFRVQDDNMDKKAMLKKKRAKSTEEYHQEATATDAPSDSFFVTQEQQVGSGGGGGAAAPPREDTVIRTSTGEGDSSSALPTVTPQQQKATETRQSGQQQQGMRAPAFAASSSAGSASGPTNAGEIPGRTGSSRTSSRAGRSSRPIVLPSIPTSQSQQQQHPVSSSSIGDPTLERGFTPATDYYGGFGGPDDDYDDGYGGGGFTGGGYGASAASTNMRTAMAELKRMLRQPVPSVSLGNRFETKTRSVGGTRTRKG